MTLANVIPIEHGHPWYEHDFEPGAEQAFADAFREIAGVTMMDFGSAIAGVKAGHKVYREQWSLSEPGKHVKLAGVDSVVLVVPVPEPGAHGVVSATYTAGPDDMLAEDWRFYNAELGDGDVVAGDPVARATYSGQDGPTIPQETIDNGNATFVDTASAGAVPVAPREDGGHNVGGIHIPRVGGARVDGDDDPTGS